MARLTCLIGLHDWMHWTEELAGPSWVAHRVCAHCDKHQQFNRERGWVRAALQPEKPTT